jgi:hypothetical protein
LVTSVDDPVLEIIPTTFSLEQNYPNPFNPSTTIEFNTAKKSFVALTVFNVMGQIVAKLINEELQKGNYRFHFDASKLSSGIYFYNLTADNFSKTHKMILLK